MYDIVVMVKMMVIVKISFKCGKGCFVLGENDVGCECLLVVMEVLLCIMLLVCVIIFCIVCEVNVDFVLICYYFGNCVVLLVEVVEWVMVYL